MKTLLHICCAPCANQCIDALRQEGVELTGFWYNHPTRVFASVTLFAIPLAAQGAQVFVSLACRAISKARGRKQNAQEPVWRIPGLDITRPQAAAITVAALAAFALPLPLPGAMSCIDLIGEMRGFYDPNGQGNGSIPDSLVVVDGQVYYAANGERNGFVGFDSNYIMHVGMPTLSEIQEKSIMTGPRIASRISIW